MRLQLQGAESPAEKPDLPTWRLKNGVLPHRGTKPPLSQCFGSKSRSVRGRGWSRIDQGRQKPSPALVCLGGCGILRWSSGALSLVCRAGRKIPTFFTSCSYTGFPLQLSSETHTQFSVCSLDSSLTVPGKRGSSREEIESFRFQL